MDLETYKKEKNLCSQDVVNRISKYYPKFDLPLELAVCDNDTGVVLEDLAEAVLTTKYGPVPKRRERRRKDSRCSTRLTAEQAKLVKKTLTAHGMTMQKLLYDAIDAFMRVAAPEGGKKKTPGRRQPFRAQRNKIMFSITSKGGKVNGWQERLFEEDAGKPRCKVLNVGSTISQWASQIALDALVTTLGYGDCMKNDPWGGATHRSICERVADLCG